MKDIPTGTATITLDDLFELMKSEMSRSEDFPVGGITELHAKWKKIFMAKRYPRTDFIKLNIKLQEELLTDILNLLK